jgi:MYND finger
MLFFVMVMTGATEPAMLWKSMFHLQIDKETFDHIKFYAEELFDLSSSPRLWEMCGYSDTLRFYNSESLEAVREIWRRYSSPDNTTASFIENYNNAIKKVYETHHKDVKPTDTLAMSMKRFWKSGASASPDKLPNPLFAYSRSGSRFAVDPDSNPLAGFPLTPAVAKLAPDSPFYLRGEQGSGTLEAATTSSKLQFQAWCNSFRTLRQENRSHRLVIRFFVGDAIAFCLGLHGLRTPEIAPNCYSRPGTTKMLRLDDDDEAPKTFDVVDTGYLIDRIGALNVLPHAAYLLKNATSVLYTSTRVNDIAEERNHLSKMLCADVGIMCLLLCVVPAAYLNGHTTQAYHEFHDSRPHTAIPLTNRIMWVLMKTGDPLVDFDRGAPSVDLDAFAKFLFDLYNNMFAFESSQTRDLTGNHAYTRYTFAVLLRYFMRRIISIDWRDCIMKVIDLLVKECQKNEKLVRLEMGELFIQLALTEVYTGAIDNGSWVVPGGRTSIGVLGKHNPPDPCIIVLTVPRSSLQKIYDKLSTHAAPPPIAFQLFAKKDQCLEKDCKCLEEYCTVSCVQTVFGRLVPSSNGHSGTIEEDQSGWEGTSDLHVCAYFSSLMLRDWIHSNDGVLNFGVALTPTNETVKVFEPELGATLTVWTVCFGQASDAVHFFDRLPGLAPHRLREIHFDHEYRAAQTSNFFVVNFPVLDFEKPSFTTRVKVIGAAFDRLQKKENISVNQHSPCTLTITFGPYQVQVDYLFPVDGANARLRVSRKAGWIEIIAPLVSPGNRGFFTATPFPTILYRGLAVYNTLRPHVNFRQLPKIDGALANRDAFRKDKGENDTTSIPDHLISMNNNQELSFGLPMTQIKLHIHTLLFPHAKPTVLKFVSPNSRHVDIFFFLSGLYFDPSSRSVVGEGYVLLHTASVSKLPTQALDLKLKDEDMIWWKAALPGMVEQARMWKHKAGCEYKITGIPCPGASPICTCGRGQVMSSFTNVSDWKPFAPHVTRIAITPIFPAPWLDSTRRNFPEGKQEAIELGGLNEPKKCQFCEKVGAGKKCAKCMNVVYCSRACQVADWPVHKTTCGSAAATGQRGFHSVNLCVP